TGLRLPVSCVDAVILCQQNKARGGGGGHGASDSTPAKPPPPEPRGGAPPAARPPPEPRGFLSRASPRDNGPRRGPAPLLTPTARRRTLPGPARFVPRRSGRPTRPARSGRGGPCRTG